MADEPNVDAPQPAPDTPADAPEPTPEGGAPSPSFYKQIVYKVGNDWKQYDCTSEKMYDAIAAEGARVMAEEYQRKANPNHEPETPAPVIPTGNNGDDTMTDDDDSVIARQIRELTATVQSLKKDNEALRTESAKEREERQRNEELMKRRTYLDRLARDHHVDDANDKQQRLARTFIETRALEKYEEAASNGQPISHAAAYKEAAKEVSEFARDGVRDILLGKIVAKGQAVQSTTGAAGVLPPATPMPKDKAGQKKLAQEWEDGTTRSKAMDHYRKLMSTAPPEMAGAP